MIRNLISEICNQAKICFYKRKEIKMIIERIIYKIDPNNMPDIGDLKKMIKEESGYR